MENSVFHCLAKEGKWGGRKTREKIFSPGPTKFILPNQEENTQEKSALIALLQKYPVSKKKKKTERESAREKKERMRAGAALGTFLNEEDKENKRRGMEIRTTCVEEKKKEKKMYG